MNSAKPMNGNHGATPLGGKTAGTAAPINGKRRSTPTYAQRNLMGFGLTILDRTLSFTDSAHNLFAVGEFGSGMLGTSVKTGEIKTYRFKVQSGTPFRVTLVWSDAPGSTAAQKALVNNLDLQVSEEATGVQFVVNGFEQTEVDDMNPFEQVDVYQPTDQYYVVKVVGTQIVVPHPATQGQPFSLVNSLFCFVYMSPHSCMY